MPKVRTKAPTRPRTAGSSSSSSSSPKLTPKTYRALKTEQGVFTTPPYSADLKGLWKFKDAATAQQSAGALWERFEAYKEKDDFVGMDMTRKFIQMGRTRSLRYALRKGGRKYEIEHSDDKDKGKGQGKGKRKRGDADQEQDDHDDVDDGNEGETGRAGRKEIPRTGKVYDQGKLEGANIFEGYLDRCWADEVYARAWEDWRKAGKKA